MSAVGRMADFAATILAKYPAGIDKMIALAALAPKQFKGHYLNRLMQRLLDKGFGPQNLITTDLGLNHGLRLEVRLAESKFAFGAPARLPAHRATIDLITKIVSSSDAFLDVGANYGLYTLALIATCRNRAELPALHLFEPDPELFTLLKGNLTRNAICALVQNQAVGEIPGKTEFYRNLSDASMGSLDPDLSPTAMREKTMVDVINLSDYLAQHEIQKACIKVDVEGTGVDVWRGMASEKARIRWLITEVVGAEWQARLPDQIKLATGWHAYYIRDYELRRYNGDSDYGYLPQCYNWLFCKDDANQLRHILAGSRFRVTTEPDSVYRN